MASSEYAQHGSFIPVDPHCLKRDVIATARSCCLGLAAALLLVSSTATAQVTFDCQALQVRAPASGTAMYPRAVAAVPLDKQNQGYVRVSGGCEVSRAGYESPHAEVMVQNSPDGEAGWRCKGADPAGLPNAAWAKASVTFCRASDPGASSLRLHCTVLTKKTGPSRNPSAEVTLSKTLIDEGYSVVSGGCDSSHSQNGSTHAENVVSSRPSSDGLGWFCQAADPPNIVQDATVEASLVACRAAIDPAQEATLSKKPSLFCSVSQGEKVSGSSPKSIAKASGRVLGGGCALSYVGNGSAHAEFMVQHGPQDGTWVCLAADPPNIPNPGSAQASAVTCEIVSLTPPAANVAKEAGPLFSQADADKRCPTVCARPLSWNGQWWTTIPNKMSVCACAEPPPAVPTAPAPGTKKTMDYKWDESNNRGGPTSCVNDNMCDGVRTCSANHWCTGPLRTQPPKSESFRVDETKNKKGPSQCSNNTECDGLRTCSQMGWCQGTARPSEVPAKGPGYRVDESKNAFGRNRCSNDRECDGARTCQSGLCTGKARGGLDLCDFKELWLTAEQINNNLFGCR